MKKLNIILISSLFFLLVNCNKKGCEYISDTQGYPVYDNEIEKLFYKGDENIDLLHFVNGLLLDTLHLKGFGGFRIDSIRAMKYDELSGCPMGRVLDQTYVIKYSDNLNLFKILLVGGQQYEKITSLTSINFEIKNKKFKRDLAYISNINDPKYIDSVILNGIKYFNVNKIYNGIDTSNYLFYGYKTGVNYIKIENEIFQSF